MKKEKYFTLSNGEVVTDEKEAITKQKKIDFEKAIWIFANKNAAYNENVELLGNAIIDNKDELKAIFDSI